MEAAVLLTSEMAASEHKHKQNVKGFLSAISYKFQAIPAHLLICGCCLFVAECHAKCTFHIRDLILCL